MFGWHAGGLKVRHQKERMAQPWERYVKPCSKLYMVPNLHSPVCLSRYWTIVISIYFQLTEKGTMKRLYIPGVSINVPLEYGTFSDFTSVPLP